MKSISIQSLINQETTIHPDYAEWYDFYLNFIIPKLSHEQICDEYQRARFTNTAIIKNGKQWQFMHNSIIVVVLNDLAFQEIIEKNDFLQVAEFKADEQTNFIGILIFETLDIITRHSKELTSQEAYYQLGLLINKDYWKIIYPNRKFNKTNFCHFISLPL